jgi:hypothetical protein
MSRVKGRRKSDEIPLLLRPEEKAMYERKEMERGNPNQPVSTLPGWSSSDLSSPPSLDAPRPERRRAAREISDGCHYPNQR